MLDFFLFALQMTVFSSETDEACILQHIVLLLHIDFERGGGAASHTSKLKSLFISQPFGPESEDFSPKMAKMILFGKNFRTKGLQSP